ncbi:hypothetical protein BC938DRAFT_483019 [Jimgerdemannia flammicorona]|uniref:Zn(2)-C6 fungal-type domain-containing protein n=1 Tax=Jimgerdemannia flammicorona TaxID=994334 RepID=A0A433QCR7_9FUNG|nr:hypothetical protein BC938DRAFT_483019 [Jimgerdemannia flammicorona]
MPTNKLHIAKATDRTAVACVRCRHKQAKCDGATPRCRRCEYSDEECTYVRAARTKRDEEAELKRRPLTLDKQRQRLVAQIRGIEGQMQRMREEMISLGGGREYNSLELVSTSSESGEISNPKLKDLNCSDFPRDQSTHVRPTKRPKPLTFADHPGCATSPEETTQAEMADGALQVSRTAPNHKVEAMLCAQPEWTLTIIRNGIRIQTDIRNIQQLQGLIATSLPKLSKVPSELRRTSNQPLFILWNQWSNNLVTGKKQANSSSASAAAMAIADQNAMMLAYTRAHQAKILRFIVKIWLGCDSADPLKHAYVAYYSKMKPLPVNFKMFIYSVGFCAASHVFTYHQSEYDETLPAGVSGAQMGEFVSKYFFPQLREGIFAYLEDPKPDDNILTTFIQTIHCLFYNDQFQMASLYLSIAVRSIQILESHASKGGEFQCLYWIVFVSYDELLTSVGFAPVINDREKRVADVLRFVHDAMPGLNPESNLQFQFAYTIQSSITREILDTFYSDESRQIPSTADLERFEDAWAEWWDALHPTLRSPPDNLPLDLTRFMNSRRLKMIHEIGLLDIYLPFIDDFDSCEHQPTPHTDMHSLAERAARICADCAVNITKTVLEIHRHRGCWFPLFELGRACEVHIQNLKSTNPEVVTLARVHLALSWKMLSESARFGVGEVEATRYAGYLKEVMAKYNIEVKEAAVVDVVVGSLQTEPMAGCDLFDWDRPYSFWDRVAKNCWIRRQNH